MSRHEGRCLARCARRLGLDRNPLRRRTDRVEAAIRLATIILLLVGVPIAAIAASRQADHLAMRQAHAQAAVNHQVTAILLQQASATGIADLYTSTQMIWVLARWQPPGQRPRSGEVLATAGARAGSTVTIWIDKSGAVASPPPDHRLIVGGVCIAVITISLVGSLLLLASNAPARRDLERRRLAAWGAEWRAVGPLWSGHRS